MDSYFLIYVSYASKLWTRKQLISLRDQAVQFNKSNDITGVMLYLRERFIQVLEGDKATVLALYQKILTNTGHHDAVIMLEGWQESRQFADWSMGFKTISEKEIEDSHELSELVKNLNTKSINGAHPAIVLINKFFKKNV